MWALLEPVFRAGEAFPHDPAITEAEAPRSVAVPRQGQADGQHVHLPMLRIHANRDSLLAALTTHWAEQQLQIVQQLRPEL